MGLFFLVAHTHSKTTHHTIPLPRIGARNGRVDGFAPKDPGGLLIPAYTYVRTLFRKELGIGDWRSGNSVTVPRCPWSRPVLLRVLLLQDRLGVVAAANLGWSGAWIIWGTEDRSRQGRDTRFVWYGPETREVFFFCPAFDLGCRCRFQWCCRPLLSPGTPRSHNLHMWTVLASWRLRDQSPTSR